MATPRRQSNGTTLAALSSGALLGVILLATTGCTPNEEITRTTEPRVEYGKSDEPKAAHPQVEKIPTRILGAIAAADEGESWFFKMMGPAEEVSKQEAAFDAFVSSIEIGNQKNRPVSWRLPEGWREGPQKGRYATLLTSPAKDAVELAVSTAGGNLLDNVNRWRGQVGLEPVKQENLEAACREVTTKQGKKLIRVDAKGMAAPGPAMPPFMKGK